MALKGFKTVDLAKQSLKLCAAVMEELQHSSPHQKVLLSVLTAQLTPCGPPSGRGSLEREMLDAAKGSGVAARAWLLHSTPSTPLESEGCENKLGGTMNCCAMGSRSSRWH